MPYALVGGALAGLAVLGILFAARPKPKATRPPPAPPVSRPEPEPRAKAVEPPAPPVVAPEP